MLIKCIYSTHSNPLSQIIFLFFEQTSSFWLANNNILLESPAFPYSMLIITIIYELVAFVKSEEVVSNRNGSALPNREKCNGKVMNT